ncbi:MAG: class I SAM-dependent methyltransferase, partial [Chthoniobacterales bacterium]
MKRDCPICSSDAKRNLYHQSFGDSPAAFPIKGYDVVVCQSCGLGYADGVPNQQEMDTYYKQVSKYEIADRAGKVSAVALKNYQDEVESLASFLPDKDVSILDIGCATGALLSVFQRNGYKNVRGIDPSPSCGRVAAELYAIEVTQGSVFEIGSFAEPFDVVVFSSVLEHVIDLRGALNRAKRMLAPDGLLVAEVPDTVNFNFGTSAPFQEFSVEHVNFFSPMSLSNLLRQEGFEVLAIWHDFRLMGTESFPSLTAVFRKKEVSETRAIIRDG